MKYEIHVNQRAIIEHSLDIDLVDGAIMDFCRFFSASHSCRFIVENGKRYYWFSHKIICEQLPILRLKHDSVYRRMKALSDKSFLDVHPDNKQMNASWYAFGPLADLLVSTIGAKSEGSDINPKVNPKKVGLESGPSDQNPDPIGSKSGGPSDQNPMYKEIIDKENNNTPTTPEKTSADAESTIPDPLPKQAIVLKLNDATQLIEKHRSDILNAPISKDRECKKLRIDHGYYDLLTNAFFDKQLSDAERKVPIEFYRMKAHFDNWMRKQVSLGADSDFHPSHQPVKPPVQQPGFRGPINGHNATVTAHFKTATPD